MNKIINYENLRSFAYSNDRLINGDIKGIVLDFFGLGGQHMFNDCDPETGKLFAKENIVFIVPYSNPWGWMNKQEISLTDTIIDVIFEKYNLNDSTPIVSTGGSMGGLCSLVYTYYAKRTPVACVSNCPVCDLPYHFTERVDLPRTIYSAFWDEEGELNQILERFSPLHLAPKMPKVSYTLFHCDKDDAVNIKMHSDKLYHAMLENEHNISYYVVPDRGHCDLSEEMHSLYYQIAKDSILNNK